MNVQHSWNFLFVEERNSHQSSSMMAVSNEVGARLRSRPWGMRSATWRSSLVHRAVAIDGLEANKDGPQWRWGLTGSADPLPGMAVAAVVAGAETEPAEAATSFIPAHCPRGVVAGELVGLLAVERRLDCDVLFCRQS